MAGTRRAGERQVGGGEFGVRFRAALCEVDEQGPVGRREGRRRVLAVEGDFAGPAVVNAAALGLAPEDDPFGDSVAEEARDVEPFGSLARGRRADEVGAAQFVAEEEGGVFREVRAGGHAHVGVVEVADVGQVLRVIGCHGAVD